MDVTIMRRFEIIYKTPPHKLTRSLTTTVDLEPYVNAYLQQLYSTCSGLPTVKADVSWANMTQDTLAYTYTYFRPQDSIWVPANEFEIYFNPHVQWWNGTCANKPSSHYDLQSAIMHEILHGIGYLSTIGPDKMAYPTNFDRMIQDSTGNAMVQTSGQYTGEFGQQVFVQGIQIYNPNSFESGSSFSHMHQSSRLMSWYQNSCHRDIRQDTKTILNGLGYNCGNTPITSHSGGGGGGSSMGIIGAVGGIVVIIAVVLGVVLSKSSGRKKRNLEPLLPKK